MIFHSQLHVCSSDHSVHWVKTRTPYPPLGPFPGIPSMGITIFIVMHEIINIPGTPLPLRRSYKVAVVERFDCMMNVVVAVNFCSHGHVKILPSIFNYFFRGDRGRTGGRKGSASIYKL